MMPETGVRISWDIYGDQLQMLFRLRLFHLSYVS